MTLLRRGSEIASSKRDLPESRCGGGGNLKKEKREYERTRQLHQTPRVNTEKERSFRRSPSRALLSVSEIVRVARRKEKSVAPGDESKTEVRRATRRFFGNRLPITCSHAWHSRRNMEGGEEKKKKGEEEKERCCIRYLGEKPTEKKVDRNAMRPT